MKKSKVLIAVLAAIMFVLAAFGLVACDKDAGDLGGGAGTTTGGGDKSYTVTFNYGEGSGTPVSAKTSNGKVTLPTPTPPNGKTFDAWYDAATGGNKVTNSTTYTKNTIVYARYTDGSTPTPAGEYTITLDATTNGGTCATTSLPTTNKKLSNLPNATKGTDTFNGWFTAATGGTKIDANYTFDGTVTTIYAQFTAQGSTVITGNKVLVGSTEKATLSAGTTAGMAYDYYADGVVLATGDKVKFSIEGATIAVVWVDQSAKLTEAGTDVQVTGNIPEVTVSEGGTYTVSIKQSTADSTNGSNKWQIWIGVPGGGGLTEGMVATENGTQASDKPNIYLIKNGDRTQGYFVTYTGTNGDGYDEYSVTVALAVGDQVSMYVPSWGENGSGWECVKLNPYTDAAIAETSGNFIVMKDSGTFTFYFQTKYGDDRIYIGK